MGKKMGVYGLEHKRNRLAGQIEQIRRANQQYLIKMDRMREKYAANESKICTLQSAIDTLTHAAQAGFGTTLECPIPRRTVPKMHLAPWGAVSREMLKQLRLAGDEGLATVEVASRVRQSLSLSLNQAQYSHLKVQVSRNLWRMLSRGTVVRLDIAMNPGESTTWALAASA